MCCFERKEDNCCCMRIYHLMDKGEQCVDKAILCRLEKMKDCECHDKKDCGKKDDCCDKKDGYSEDKYKVRENKDCGCRKQHDCKPDYKPDCKPDRKPDCSEKRENPELRCECGCNWKPDYDWCYPYTVIK